MCPEPIVSGTGESAETGLVTCSGDYIVGRFEAWPLGTACFETEGTKFCENI